MRSCASFSPNLSALDLHLNTKCQSVILLSSEISTVRSTRKRKVESIAFKQTDLARIMICLQLKYQWLSFHITHHCFFHSHLNKGDVACRSPPFSISTQLHLCPDIFFKKGIFKWKSLKAFKSFLVVLYGSCVGVIYQHLACNSFPFKLSFQYIKNLVVLKGAVRQDNDNYWFKRKEKNILLKVFLNNEYLWRNLKERRCKLFSNVKCFTFFLFCVFLAHSALLK